MKHFFEYISALLCNFQWLATFFTLWNSFFSRSSVFHYRKLGLYTRKVFMYLGYLFRFYYLFILDKTLGRLQIEFIDPLKQVLKIAMETTAILILLFEVIEKVPNKEIQRGMYIASVILMINYMKKKIEQIEEVETFDVKIGEN